MGNFGSGLVQGGEAVKQRKAQQQLMAMLMRQGGGQSQPGQGPIPGAGTAMSGFAPGPFGMEPVWTPPTPQALPSSSSSPLDMLKKLFMSSSR